MKQIISYKVDTPASVQHFITTWKRLKHYPQTDYLTVGECIELLISTTRNMHKDDSVGRFFNNMLDNGESIIGYDGKELLDILKYQVVQAIQKKLSISI